VLTVSEDPLAWAIKLAAITEENRILDEDLSDKTIGEELFGDTEMQKTARPGTSLKTPHQNEKGVFNPNGPSVRPQTGSRPLTGFARPGTSTRPGTGQVRLDTGRLNTASRPLTNQGRRLQTGQIDAESDQFLNLSRMNLTTFAENRNISKERF
jgi:tetratricopeptide repeat protein 8